jgi:DNA polymerase-1
MPTQNKTVVIIDGNAIIHRAYHALPPLTAPDGTLVNAVYGFASMLLKVMADLKPDYLVTTFDVAGGTFRDEIYTEYKATRAETDQALYDQIPLVHELVKGFNVPIYTKIGFEADDLIGTLAKQITEKHSDITCIIVTGDKDLLQLVDNNKIEVYLLRKGMSDFELFNEAHVQEKFGFSPAQMIDYKSLRGDTSDNIPGVKGVGEKTATELLTNFGTLENIYEALKKEDAKISASVQKKLTEGYESALMSKKLATIDTAVPDIEYSLPEMQTTSYKREEVIELFKKFGFYSLVKRVSGGADAAEEKTGKKSTQGGSASGRKEKKMKVGEVVNVDTKNISELAALIQKYKVCACLPCFQQENGNILTSTCTGIVCVVTDTSWMIPLSLLEKLPFNSEDITIVGHDVKQFVKLYTHVGVEFKAQLFDVMIASYLLNSSTRAHDMESIAIRELGIELPNTDQSSLFGIDPQIIATELAAMLKVKEQYEKQLVSESEKGLFENIEMALIPVLAHMELSGVAIDIPLLGHLSVKIAKTIKELEKNIWKEAGKEFNVSSSTQLRDILFVDLDLPTDMIKKGKTGYSTAASELEKLRELHSIIPFIEEYREVEKLRNTYIDVLPTLINPKTGRIHTTFNQAIAATGRLSSIDPNLQNIPIRTELGKDVRKAFIADSGNKLISADYSQIELRIVASLANDEKMIEIFKKGEDIHTATAAAIHNIPLDKVTKDIRRSAKEVNFGVLYGMGAFGLASRTGISQFEAKEFIQKYFDTFAGVKKYMDDTLERAKETGYVETLFGRKRYVLELQSPNRQITAAGERMAINMPIQGTAADIMKMAMIAVYHALKKENFLDTHARMTLQIHDELVLEVEEKYAEIVAEIVKREMQNVAKLKVPIDVGVEIGDRWGEMK